MVTHTVQVKITSYELREKIEEKVYLVVHEWLRGNSDTNTELKGLTGNLCYAKWMADHLHSDQPNGSHCTIYQVDLDSPVYDYGCYDFLSIVYDLSSD